MSSQAPCDRRARGGGSTPGVRVASETREGCSSHPPSSPLDLTDLLVHLGTFLQLQVGPLGKTARLYLPAAVEQVVCWGGGS
jgi:hypothetical protein